ncbi:MAG: protoporphyrinogen oxidase [Candidatus Rokubacteria bacterium]|nr:protoporphyrinogen oxidase [Candidatus Rokubacteria bacterium]
MKLAVVGGGLAGLAAAHRALELARASGRAVELELLEADGRLGGTIRTESRDGFLVECGPDSFLSEKPWALDLCRRLGVEDRLVRTDDRFRKTFVVHEGRLHPLPDGFQLLAPTRFGPFLRSGLFSWRGKLRMGLDLVLPRGADPDESLGAFVRRRLGREALERVAQPLVAGIYTADPDALSLAATMPRFLELERRERSLIRALWRAARQGGAAATGTSGARWSLFVTFARGMEELVRVLAERLPPEAVRLKERVIDVHRAGARWRVLTTGSGAVEADAVVIATEAYQTARMLRYLDPGLAHLLGDIPYAGSATVNLAYPRAGIPHALDGFGFVVPRAERRPVLAATFSSVKYPGRAPAGHALLRVFLGGAMDEDVLERDDEVLVAASRGQLAELLGIRAEPMFTRVSRYPRAMPQYHVGHLARIEAIEAAVARHPGLALAGAAYRGVGIADCVRSGEEAAARLLAVTTTAPDPERRTT